MHLSTVMATGFSRNYGAIWLTCDVAIVVGVMFAGRRLLAANRYREAISTALLIPFINILVLVLIARSI
jgi:hypothetical protein